MSPMSEYRYRELTNQGARHVVRQKEEKAPKMKLLFLQWLWLFCLILPMRAGDWYDDLFSFYQSAISLILILAVLRAYRTDWAKSFACCALLQIVLNAHDALAGTPADVYNAIQAVLNTLEFIILFFVGTVAEIGAIVERGGSYRYFNHRDSSGR